MLGWCTTGTRQTLEDCDIGAERVPSFRGSEWPRTHSALSTQHSALSTRSAGSRVSALGAGLSRVLGPALPPEGLCSLRWAVVSHLSNRRKRSASIRVKNISFYVLSIDSICVHRGNLFNQPIGLLWWLNEKTYTWKILTYKYLVSPLPLPIKDSVHVKTG